MVRFAGALMSRLAVERKPEAQWKSAEDSLSVSSAIGSGRALRTSAGYL